jgi:hypothetical protein
MSLADHSVTYAIEKRLKQASNDLNKLAPIYGHAKQVIEIARDRRKNLLADYALLHLKAGESAVSAETRARADAEFKKQFEEQASELETAYSVVGQWDALHVRWETGRSLLALTREQLKTMPE